MNANSLPDVVADVPLTAAQLRFFDVFGFLALPGVLADQACDIGEEFEAVWRSKGGGHNGQAHDGRARSCIVPFIDQSAKLSALLDHPVLHGAMVSLLGADFNYMGSDGNFYVGNTPWHRDGYMSQLRIKIAFYLDPLTASQGALRVIPGSHRFTDAYAREVGEVVRNPESVGTDGPGIPSVALETTPGDVVLFHHNTLHSSWGGSARRRMFTMNLQPRYSEDRLPELQQYLAGHARFLIERNVGPAMLATATPGRMRHLEQVMANDFVLTERTRALSATTRVPARS